MPTRRAVGGDHRSRLVAGASSPASARSPRSSRASRRSAAATRRSRRSGSCRRRSLGVDLEGLLDRAVEMAEACRLDEGNPGLELGLALGQGWRDGRDKVCLPDAGVFGLWVEQLIAESTGKEGKGLVPAPGVPGDGPDRQEHEVRLPGAARARAGVLPLGVRDRGRRARCSASTRSTSPTCRRRRTGRTRCSRRGDVEARARGLGRRAAGGGRAARLRLRPGVRRSDARRMRARIAAFARSLGERTGCVVHARLRAALPPLDRPAAQGRAEHRHLRPGRGGLRRRAPDPRQAVRVRQADPRPGGGRLRVAARARPPHRAHPPRGGVGP